MNKKTKHYMDKKQGNADFVKWLKLVKENEEKGIPREKTQVSDEIAKYIYDVAKNVANKSCYRGYSYREDMEAYAMMKMVAAAHKYDPDREGANAYAFLSYITDNSFKEFIPKEQAAYMLPKKIRVSTQDINSLVDGGMDSDISSSSDNNSNDNTNALTVELYIQEVESVNLFDKKLEEKKKFRKARFEELKLEKALALKNKEIEL